MNPATVLCQIDDIALPGSLAFSLGAGARRREIFVVRGPGGVFAYENICPHTGSMLDWLPGQFLSFDKAHILCATHGALFRPGDGFCVHGPCAGKSLTAVAIKLAGDEILLVDEPPLLCR